MNTRFLVADGVLIAAQAALVALPDAGIPPWLERLKSRGWALVLPLSVAVVVGAIALVPAVADALTWVALVLVPVGAALALGWAMHGARPWLGLLVVPLLAFAWADVNGLAGDSVAALLTALSTVTVGRLLAGGVPLVWLKAGIVAMAIVDSILVFGNEARGAERRPQRRRRAARVAATAVHRPALREHRLRRRVRRGRARRHARGRGPRQWPVAVLTFVLSGLLDLLFFHFDTLPATVPVAAALIISELWQTPVIRRRPGASAASSS